MLRAASVVAVVWIGLAGPAAVRAGGPLAGRALRAHQWSATKAAVEDLIASYGDRYAGGRGPAYVRRLEALRADLLAGRPEAKAQFERLRREALLANPLLDFDRLLVVKRRPNPAVRRPRSATDQAIGYSGGDGRELGMPSNHECNSSLERTGYDNEIAVLSPVRPDGRLSTLYRPPDGGYVGEVDLHWDGRRLLLTRSDAENWKIYEIRSDGTGLRQVSRMPADVDCMDPCYLPNGRIVFGSTASYQSVPCWHGRKWVTNLYLMNADGSGVRQLCYDQDHDLHPVVLENGQVLFNRWDYTGITHIFMRQLMVMNPDGTGQRAIYGSNSWYPNALYFPRQLPGKPNQFICILSGYHGVHRMGRLVIVDTSRGCTEAAGVVRRISGCGAPVDPQVRDNLIGREFPRFLHPFPLSDKYFLVACQPRSDAPWGVYLADVFDNLVLLCEEPGYALLEPMPLRPRPTPPAIPERVDLARRDAVVYLHDIYAGPGLAGVPRGEIKSLRVVAYHFGYRGLAGSDKVGYGGPWEVMRILGTVPLEEDGSATFRVPANTPLAVQALNEQGEAVQWMRSWFTAMPGEYISCVGCHEKPAEASSLALSRAALSAPRPIDPWYGPPRGFSFVREVQPVLNKHCVSCHNGPGGAQPDLRPPDQVEQLATWPIGYVPRLHPDMLRDTGGRLTYAPAYDALIHYIRRVGIEDDVSLLTPGEYQADTSELVQLLRKGHAGVRLSREDWDRLITWIDLNAPCHGTWGEVYPIPDGAHERRMELRRRFGGPNEDPEAIPPTPPVDDRPVPPRPLRRPAAPRLAGWPLTPDQARRAQQRESPGRRTIDLGAGVTLELAWIPPGRFVMGDPNGQPDEWPPNIVRISRPFWLGRCEVTNEQFRRFDPSHDSGYYVKRRDRADGKGLPLDLPQQPAVRVSWEQAMAFCQWLSNRTGLAFRLPTEAEWEYACRAGSATPLHYGGLDDDFSSWANLADDAFSRGLIQSTSPMHPPGTTQATGGVPHLVLEGARLSDTRFRDDYLVTAPVGSFAPNPWGLYDLHGNAAEWTLSQYRPYPYRRGDGRERPSPDGLKVVRGGSFFDRPARCRAAFRLAYPAWRRIFNVGFRVACDAEPAAGERFGAESGNAGEFAKQGN